MVIPRELRVPAIAALVVGVGSLVVPLCLAGPGLPYSALAPSGPHPDRTIGSPPGETDLRGLTASGVPPDPVAPGAAACRSGLSATGGCAAQALGGTSALQSLDWVNLTGLSAQNPGICFQGSMAYDPQDRYAVAFGGCSSNATWVYASGQWTELNISGPSPRNLPGMTYDAADGYILLFGGGLNFRTYNDTWAFRNGSWTQLHPAKSPPPRWAMGLAYDAVDGYVVLYGGNYPPNLGDTWTFRNSTWTQLTLNASSTPGLRGAFGMTYDATDRYVLLFGGYNDTLKVVNGTWAFAHGNWTRLRTASEPSPRFDDQITYDPPLGAAILYSGENWVATGGEAPVGGMWGFSNGSWTRLHPVHTPGNVTFWRVVWDAADGLALAYDLFNYANSRYYNSTWGFGPPIVGQLTVSPSTIDLGQSAAFSVRVATNARNLSYGFTGLPGGCDSANLSVLRCIPNSTGTFPVRVNVSDPSGFLIHSNATLVVGVPPLIEEFTATPSALDRGQELALNVTAANGSGVLSYSYDGLPGGCASHDSANLTCVVMATGNFTVDVHVTDPVGGNSTAGVVVRVAPDPSLSLRVSPSVIDRGQDTQIVASVQGGTGAPTYLYSGLPNGCQTTNAPQLACRPNARASLGCKRPLPMGRGTSSARRRPSRWIPTRSS